MLVSRRRLAIVTWDARVSLGREARGLALRAQSFGDSSSIEPIDLLERLGAIQMDSVNILARNHLLVPFSRLGPYSVSALHTAIYQERRGFEYWGHQASWLPMAEYRYFLPRMMRMRETSRGWWLQARTENAELYPLVLERVRAEGALGAAAFEDPRGGRGTWWDWKTGQAGARRPARPGPAHVHRADGRLCARVRPRRTRAPAGARHARPGPACRQPTPFAARAGAARAWRRRSRWRTTSV